MTSRTDQFRALPRAGQAFVAVALAALAVVLWVMLSGAEDDSDSSACGRFRALVDDVQGGEVDPGSDEVLDRLEVIGAQMRNEGGDIGNAGAYLISQSEVARLFPEDRDDLTGRMVNRADEACS